jgi:hypothetical protein
MVAGGFGVSSIGPLASRSLTGCPRPARTHQRPRAAGDGTVRGIVTTSPRDFAACGTKWRGFDYPAAAQQTQVKKCCFGNPGSMRRNSVLKRKA